MAFAPDGYAHTEMFGETSARNPVLLWTIIEPLKSDDLATAAHGVAVAAWVLQNVLHPSWQNQRAR